jgi:uncharacterized membrane protein YdjX (TVP38/TMEM64 family)
MPAPPTTGKATASGFSWKRLIPLAIIVAGIAAFFLLGLNEYATLEHLRQHRGQLMGFVAANPRLSVVLFITIYALATSFALPGGALLTVTGGFLFGIWLGAAAVVVGATIGATTLFVIARSALGDLLRAKAGPFLAKMEAGFKENALSYLFVLRLIPAFPFFVVNLVPAFLGVPLRTFIIATFFGIMPGTFVYASIGAGLGSIFDRMEEVTLKGALTKEVVIALAGLAVLSLLPVAYKKLKSRHTMPH